METAMSPTEMDAYLAERLGDGAILESRDEYGTHTVTVPTDRLVELVTLCRDDKHLAFDFFDSSFGVDEREAGFSVITILYSTTLRHRLLIKVFADGGRENPTVPSVAHVFEGANWMERETWDMFGIEFPGHPQLAPRILTVENFEGWPLRKDFHLASRVAKPWPGVKEPAETDEDGNVIVHEPKIGDAPGPMPLDEIMAEQARRVNAVAVEEAPAQEAPVEEAAEEAPVAEAAAPEASQAPPPMAQPPAPSDDETPGGDA